MPSTVAITSCPGFTTGICSCVHLRVQPHLRVVRDAHQLHPRLHRRPLHDHLVFDVPGRRAAERHVLRRLIRLGDRVDVLLGHVPQPQLPPGRIDHALRFAPHVRARRRPPATSPTSPPRSVPARPPASPGCTSSNSGSPCVDVHALLVGIELVDPPADLQADVMHARLGELEHARPCGPSCSAARASPSPCARPCSARPPGRSAPSGPAASA